MRLATSSSQVGDDPDAGVDVALVGDDWQAAGGPGAGRGQQMVLGGRRPSRGICLGTPGKSTWTQTRPIEVVMLRIKREYHRHEQERTVSQLVC